eukprot:scaffold55220_cov19-Prasinocladus_malaysianus.AAC.5
MARQSALGNSEARAARLHSGPVCSGMVILTAGHRVRASPQVRKTTGYSPFVVMYGRNLVTPSRESD